MRLRNKILFTAFCNRGYKWQKKLILFSSVLKIVRIWVLVCDRTSSKSHDDTDITVLGDCLGPWPVTIQGVIVTYCEGEYGFGFLDNYLFKNAQDLPKTPLNPSV